MQLLLNTIMLEPNRWTGDRSLTCPLTDLLKPVAEAGFRDLEIWQYHVSRLDRGELDTLMTAMDEVGLRCAALGAYPSLHVTGSEWEEMDAELGKLVDFGGVLGIEAFKIFPGSLGSEKADGVQRSLTVERIRILAERLAERGVALTMETHGNTLCDTLDSTLRLLGEVWAA